MATAIDRSIDAMRARATSLALASVLAAGLAMPTPALAQIGQGVGLDAGQVAATAPGKGGGDRQATERAWVITPSVGVEETFTDNANLSANDKDSDLISRLWAGVSISGNTKRLTLNANYRLSGIVYASNSDENEVQHDLNAFGTLEAVEDWLFLDFSARVSQQIISAFGPQSPDSSSINDNTAQTAEVWLSPYIRGRLGNVANYDLRYRSSWLRADVSDQYDSDFDEWTGSIRSSTTFNKLGWSVDGSRQDYSYTDGRDYESDRVRAFLTYHHDERLSLSASFGRERNNIVSQEMETYNTPGFGIDWRPTPRTQLSAHIEERFFGGNGYNYSFSHRMPRSAIRFTGGRDLSNLPNQFTTVGLGSIYDLLNTQLTSRIPDQTQREAFIDDFLTATNIPANTQVTASFLATQISVQTRNELAFMVYGTRNAVTLSLSKSQSESLTDSILGDDFDLHTEIDEQGISANWSHRLNPRTSLSANVSYNESQGVRRDGGVDDESSWLRFLLSYQTQLGTRTQASVSLRRTDYDSTLSEDYTEHAVVGTLSMTF